MRKEQQEESPYQKDMSILGNNEFSSPEEKNTISYFKEKNTENSQILISEMNLLIDNFLRG